MRKLVLILIAFFAVVTFIRAFSFTDTNTALSRGADDLRETN
jgi:hypothetical protein